VNPVPGPGGMILFVVKNEKHDGGLGKLGGCAYAVWMRRERRYIIGFHYPSSLLIRKPSSS
jgi:hypothetical protein